jgi:hypothetical protein
MPVDRPWSSASDNNKEPILRVLRSWLADRHAVLEIGSGTGQHAVYFAPQFPHLVWQTSDLEPAHTGINAWMRECPADNLRAPVVLDVERGIKMQLGSQTAIDAVYSANTAHIMGWPAVCAMFSGVGELLPAAGLFLLYGPFSENGQHTSAGNRAFDKQLRASDPAMGIRDIPALDDLATQAGLTLVGDEAMPVNNRILIWRRT